MRCCATTASPPEPARHARNDTGPSAWLLAIGLLVDGSVASANRLATAPLPLPYEDRRAIETALGHDLVIQPLPATPIEDPRDFLPRPDGATRYRILRGDAAGATETHRLQPKGSTAWNYQLSGEETGFLKQSEDHSLVMAGIEDVRSNAITRYEPAEPFLPAGLTPGAEKRLTMAVSVFDREKPIDVRHQGSLRVSLRHLGSYRINVPAGRFETILLKASFHGEIGPATVVDTQYRFFAKNVGLVAMAEQRNVSAFLVYRDQFDLAKVLAPPTP